MKLARQIATELRDLAGIVLYLAAFATMVAWVLSPITGSST